MDYEYDVFISYRRKQPVMDWVRHHFHPLLEERLPDCLPYTPKIFIDWEIEAGSSWPAKIRQALKNSRCLVAVLSAEYFRSSWCLTEWHAMMNRAHQMDLVTETNPSGLIYAVRFGDGEHFSEEAKKIQYRDLEKWNSRYESFRQTIQIVELEQEMQVLCRELGKMILRCPLWQDWSITTLEANDQYDFPVPRIQ